MEYYFFDVVIIIVIFYIEKIASKESRFSQVKRETKYYVPI